ncbi:hypothetical protein P3X46_002122 [Hevea brasiliensis]|uniref:Uncharacterized protein n=1 Tax=Hevea brasiliensis TaxID=3981 RepID=A0ABQ9N5T6_HEVBR|nr:uncharacterized protein LOC110638092 [Hevea brasiliensis]KAJ9186565.1 hypothetical protein P3X46_002122 [Hevea brasiliensis]
MADQRPFGRFRLPWLSAPTTRPAAEPQPPPPRPSVEIIQAPAQPTTTIPAQRPPFRPAGIAPVLSLPPQPQAPKRTEPQPPSPPRATIESRLPASPSRARTQTRAASVPPSPSRVTSQPVSPSRATTEAPAASQTRSPPLAAPQPRAASVPPSPTRTSSQPQPTVQTVPQRPLFAPRLPGQASSQPSSPTRRATQVQPTVSQPPSPPKKLQPTVQETLQPRAISIQPPPSASQQEEPKPAVSLPLSQAAKETEEGKVELEKPKREEKTNGPAKEESLKSAISELLTASGAGARPEELLSAAFHSQQKPQEKEDKKTNISPSREIKTVSSTQPKDRNKLSESHQKTGMANGEQVSFHKGVRDDIFKFVHKLGVGQLKYPMDEKPASIVTIAGENRGASMHVGSEPARKDGSLHIHRGYKINPDDSTGTTTDGEGSTKGRPKTPTREHPVKKAYVNSNTQAINNSMLFESSVNERNPGIQLVLSHNLAESINPSAKPEPMETHKAEFNVTPAQKLTYEPTIRRRCLRGLFLEPSDSDPDNPEKPRRHGCRYSCAEKGKDKDIGVL